MALREIIEHAESYPSPFEADPVGNSVRARPAPWGRRRHFDAPIGSIRRNCGRSGRRAASGTRHRFSTAAAFAGNPDTRRKDSFLRQRKHRRPESIRHVVPSGPRRCYALHSHVRPTGTPWQVGAANMRPVGTGGKDWLGWCAPLQAPGLLAPASRAEGSRRCGPHNRHARRRAGSAPCQLPPYQARAAAAAFRHYEDAGGVMVLSFSRAFQNSISASSEGFRGPASSPFNESLRGSPDAGASRWPFEERGRCI